MDNDSSRNFFIACEKMLSFMIYVSSCYVSRNRNNSIVNLICPVSQTEPYKVELMCPFDPFSALSLNGAETSLGCFKGNYHIGKH